MNPPNFQDWLRYTWRRYTGRLKVYPELKGMSYGEYYMAYVAKGYRPKRTDEENSDG